MNLNKNDLRKIMYDFNSISNRLMQADFQDYNSILKKFLSFITNTEIIDEYIRDCGDTDQNLEIEFKQIQSSYGNLIFTLGDTDQEEIRNIFAYLKFIVDNDVNICDGVAMGYSRSSKYQDMIKGFNERVVFVLIGHIDRYLTKIGIDMGIDENIVFNISVKNGQVNIANDNSIINATNNVSVDFGRLDQLIQNVKILAQKENLNREDEDQLTCNLDVIEEELKNKEPRTNFIKTALNGLNLIKGTTEFAAAVTTLIQFVMACMK